MLQATDPMQAVEEIEEEEVVSDVEEVEENKEPTVESLGKLWETPLKLLSCFTHVE